MVQDGSEHFGRCDIMTHGSRGTFFGFICSHLSQHMPRLTSQCRHLTLEPQPSCVAANKLYHTHTSPITCSTLCMSSLHVCLQHVSFTSPLPSHLCSIQFPNMHTSLASQACTQCCLCVQAPLKLKLSSIT